MVPPPFRPVPVAGQLQRRKALSAAAQAPSAASQAGRTDGRGHGAAPARAGRGRAQPDRRGRRGSSPEGAWCPAPRDGARRAAARRSRAVARATAGTQGWRRVPAGGPSARAPRGAEPGSHLESTASGGCSYGSPQGSGGPWGPTAACGGHGGSGRRPGTAARGIFWPDCSTGTVPMAYTWADFALRPGRAQGGAQGRGRGLGSRGQAVTPSAPSMRGTGTGKVGRCRQAQVTSELLP